MKTTRNLFTNHAAIAAVALAAVSVGILAHATALTDNRDTPMRSGEFLSLTQASNHIFAGSIVCENGSAAAVPGADASGYVVVGRAETESDNTAASYSSTRAITVRRGVFRWANGGSFTDANIGDTCYVADDQTVTTAALATYDVAAGTIVDVDSDGVWVDTGPRGAAGAASFASPGQIAANTFAVQTNGVTAGYFSIVNATSLVFIASTVTNTVVEDIK